MRIEVVQLENIRSHVKSTVPFARGFNCLVGGLGCGKSSILYSIDFAFFGDPIGRGFDYLLREGAESGRVIVQFVQNGSRYRICRGLKRCGKGISQDFDELKLFMGDELVSSMKNDAVGEQLRAITGLDRELFREVVWVRQEHLKELLNVQPRERQKRLDELFGLSDYEVAWGNLAGYERGYEGERQAYEKDSDVVGLEKLSEEYNRTVEEFSICEMRLEDIAKKLILAKKSLDDADLRLARLEETRSLNEELRRREARLQAELTGLQGVLVSLTERVGVNRGSVESLRQRLGAVERQVESVSGQLRRVGMSSDQPVEALKRQISAFDDELSALRGEQEAALRGVEEDRKRVDSLSAESRCPLCLQALAEGYKSGLIQRILSENDERERTVGQLRERIDDLQRLRMVADDAFSNLRMLVPRVEELRSRIGEEDEALAGLRSELEDRGKAEKEARVRLEGLREELGRLDVSGLEAAKDGREQAFKRYCLLESELRAEEARKGELGLRLGLIRERVDRGQQKLERVNRIVKVVGVIEEVRGAYRSIQPRLRREFVTVLRSFVQQVLDGLAGGEGPFLSVGVDEAYTPFVVVEGGGERGVQNLSGGERTLLAFAYRLGLGQLIVQCRTGHGLSLLLLDEPTESLGAEDGSIYRLADAVSRFKAVEQTIAVTHSEAFAERAEHVVRLDRAGGESRVSVER